MRLAALILPAAIGLACSTGCGQAEERQFGRAETDVIRQRTADFASAFNAKEVDKILGFYSSATVFMPPNSPALRGQDAIRSFYNNLYAQGATELKMESTDVGGHGPLAYEAGTFSLNRRPPTGDHTRDRGKYLFIWRNTNGQWLIEYTSWSSDLPEKVEIPPAVK